MDILYIVGKGSRHDNAELRWSLRSLAKHGRNIGRVLVAGCPPAWLSGNVETLAVPDVELPGAKNRSIVNCVLEAVACFGLRGDFIFACDDVFLTAPIDFDSYPRYIDAYDLPDAPPHGRNRTAFDQLLIETRQWLRERACPSLRFQTHAFCRLSADVIRDNESLIRSTVTDTVRGLEILSLVGNLTLKAHPETQVVWRKDLKFADTFTPPLCAWHRGQFSISDRTFDSACFLGYMAAHYGVPCRYERTADA